MIYRDKKFYLFRYKRRRNHLYIDFNGILVFEDVYWARLNLNFGVVTAEFIDCAFIANGNDVDLINFKQIWKDKLPDLVLTCFVIKTSSTGTEIKVVARNFSVTV